MKDKNGVKNMIHGEKKNVGFYIYVICIYRTINIFYYLKFLLKLKTIPITLNFLKIAKWDYKL